MAKADVSFNVLTLLIVMFTVFLILVDESRPDAYISVSILIYFIYTAVDPRIRKYSKVVYLDLGFIVVFTSIVFIRILEVLGVI
ncbi:MAG: hypothetical protein QXL96_07210 [Ignisphaera sp.]